MIDIHSHILPGIDDGAEDVATALAMLKSAYNDGIDEVISTSHIYIEEESDIEAFLTRRNRAYVTLCEAMQMDGGNFPRIRLGAEVRLKPHIANFDGLKKLAIEGTDYILIEMPYSGWSQAHYEAIYDITVMGLKPIMAHIERFLKYRSEFSQIKSVASLFQVNAEAFLHKGMRKVLLELYYDGYVHVIGSDMHNMSSRKNNLKAAYEIIRTRYGTAFADFTEQNAGLVLDNKAVMSVKLPKLGFFDKLKLLK